MEEPWLRLVGFRGSRVVAWASINLGAHAEGDSAQGVRGLFPKGLERRATISSPPARRTLLRRLALPAVQHRYLASVVHAEVGSTTPFDPAELDLAWAKAPRSGSPLLAVAVPKDVMDGWVKRLGAAGIPAPAAAYDAAAALAWAANVPEAVLVHAGPGELTIVVVHEGIPAVSHPVPLPALSGNLPEVAARAVTQALAYAKGANGRTYPEELPLVITGNPETVAVLGYALEQRLGLPSHAFGPPVQHPPSFTPAAYAVNVGLALAHRARLAGRPLAPGGLPPLNLLPERHRPQGRFPRWWAPAAAGMTLAVLAVLGTTVAAGKAGDQADALRRGIATLEMGQRQSRLSRGMESAAEQRAQAALALANTLDTLRTGLQQEGARLSERLNALEREAEEARVRITSTAQRVEGFAVAGTSPGYERLAAYLTGIRASGLFTDARILSVEGPATETPAGTHSPLQFQILAAAPFSTIAPGR